MQCTDIPTALRSVSSIGRSLICASTAAVTVAFPGFWLTVMPGGLNKQGKAWQVAVLTTKVARDG
ncbi:hypothetical protein BDW60DRAFT_190582 [Aspergillus nidulans var. acristatus]